MSGGRRWSRGGGRDSPSSLTQGLPFTNEEAVTDIESQASTSGFSHPVAIQRERASSNAPLLSSSVGHRIPGRSFAHNTWGATDPPQYASHGVREQTQQLASWGLEQSSTLPRSSSTPAQRHHRGSDSDARSRRHAASIFGDSEYDARGSIDSSLPEAIQEVTEPTSPNNEAENPESNVVESTQGGAETGQWERTDIADRGRLPNRSRIGVPEIAVEDTDGEADERTALLTKGSIPSTGFSRGSKAPRQVEDHQPHTTGTWHHFRQRATSTWRTLTHPKTWSPKAIGQSTLSGGTAVVTALPAVFLGWLLNVLDALSYGTILFPLGEPMFEDTGPDGIAMYFVSTVIAQVVYSTRSRFKGGVGSEMIEVVPFFHKMTYLILGVMQGADPASITATVYISYCISSVITGIIFLLLGVFKLGNLVSFFPRSILTGCIGGIGVFLIVTGVEVSAGLNGNLDFDFATLSKLTTPATLVLWTVPLLLAIILFVIKLYSERPWILPTYFIAIVGIFYIVVAAAPNLSLEGLRASGWVFEKPKSGVAFYHFYTYYNLKLVDWTAVVECIPTMLALSFFGIIHVPINVPALALAVQEDDVNTNQELVNHGISNTLSGFAGSVQNYLVYANSQIVIRNGGDSRLAGFLLAAATLATWMAGPDAIGYIPIMVVGCLIYLLGIDLVKEALYDTFGQLQKLEYLMILVITLVMGFYDFVVGIFIGIVLSALIFVLQTSQISAVRAIYSGEIAESTVRRHPIHRRFLHEVGRQLCVFKLAGFLFFGTIVDVEKQVRGLLDEIEVNREPIRFLILDLHHVVGLDFSAAEAFGRIRRLLNRRHITMILSGISISSELGKSLAATGLFVDPDEEDDPPPQVFEDLNKALEACENSQIMAFKTRSELLHAQNGQRPLPILAKAGNGAESNSPSALDVSTASPRGSFLQKAVASTLSQTDAVPPSKFSNLSQPLLLIMQTFCNLSDKNIDFWHRASKYFKRVPLPRGHILYSAGDTPNGFYLLEEGMLTCTYELEQGRYQESIVAGTTCGELPFFSGTERSATVVADTEGVAWVLDQEEWDKLAKDWPEGECEILKIVLRLTSERMTAVTSYVLVNAS